MSIGSCSPFAIFPAHRTDFTAAGVCVFLEVMPREGILKEYDSSFRKIGQTLDSSTFVCGIRWDVSFWLELCFMSVLPNSTPTPPPLHLSLRYMLYSEIHVCVTQLFRIIPPTFIPEIYALFWDACLYYPPPHLSLRYLLYSEMHVCITQLPPPPQHTPTPDTYHQFSSWIFNSSSLHAVSHL